MRPADVVLVAMPFAEIQRPSIALGLLSASLAGSTIRSEIIYGNFHFAEMIGLPAYQAMQAIPTDYLLGEWCFSGDLFPQSVLKEEEYLDLVLDVRCAGFPEGFEQRKAMMRSIRGRSARHINELAQAIIAREPHIVGCSSVFQQHCASLSLLKRIRELNAQTVLLLGGANCEGEMGLETLRVFPWVDCVVSGEADTLFPDLCRLLLEEGRSVDPAALPHGAIAQASLRNPLSVMPVDGSGVPRSEAREMDALPVPDYDSFFETWRASPLRNSVQPELLAESSRGCWWGEKSHCTFCGLNGNSMRHRSKSVGRLLQELSQLSERYGMRTFQFVDNILDMSYFKDVLPALAAAPEKYSLFFEIKANLKREQVRLLADAGVRWIQPGIESLDDRVLGLIGKGNSALMNLQLLKWSSEYGIDAAWNFLCGFPGESDNWYQNIGDWLPAIFHLQPPSGLIRVRYDRFSPYHMRPRDFGLTLEASRAYPFVYPLPRESLMRLAYSFEDSANRMHIHRGLHELPGHRALQEAVHRWSQLWHTVRPVLRVHDDGQYLRFVDTRPCARLESWVANELESEVYRICDSAQTPAALLRQFSARRSTAISVQELEPVVDALCDAKVLLRLNGKLLGLAVNVPCGA